MGGGAKNENLGPCTNLNQKCVVKSSGWPHQNVPIYFLHVKAIGNYPCEKYSQENYSGEDSLHSNGRCLESSMAV